MATTYTTTQIIDKARAGGAELSVTVDANGGTLAVQREYDGGWLEIDSLDADGTTVYEWGAIGARMRLVPAGGATFEIVEVKN